MKITLLIGSLAGGGAERVVCNLANFLANKGHEVTVLTLSDKKTYDLNEKVKHEILYGESRSSLPHALINAIRMVKMNRYLRKERPDVYVTFLPKLTKVLLMQKRFVKCPIVLTERNDPKTFCEASLANAKEFDKYYRLADGYVFQTSEARDYYKSRGINVENSAVISNAINPEFLREKYEGEREKIIVGAGRLTAQKNFPLLIKAFAKLHCKYPEHQLVIYGEGSLRGSLEELCANLGVSDNVHFPGRIANIGDKVKTSSVFVLSSDYEGMPNALMEAMALGSACVSTDCGGGGARFLIKDGENGLLVPQNDVDALANAIDRILSDKDLASRLGENARKIQQELSPDRIYGQWEEFLSTLTK